MAEGTVEQRCLPQSSQRMAGKGRNNVSSKVCSLWFPTLSKIASVAGEQCLNTGACGSISYIKPNSASLCVSTMNA